MSWWNKIGIGDKAGAAIEGAAQGYTSQMNQGNADAANMARVIARLRKKRNAQTGIQTTPGQFGEPDVEGSGMNIPYVSDDGGY